MLNAILTALILTLASCSSSPKKESPVIYFSNASSDLIKNIQCSWAEKNTLSLPALTPGDSRSQSFYINKKSDFFGLIKTSWTNAEGHSIVKEFYFQEKNLPSISDHETYSYVQLYLDQDDLEVVSSDVADLSGKTRKMDFLLTKYREEAANTCVPNHIHTCPDQAAKTSLIRVQPKNDSSVPGWLTNSY